MVLGSTGDSVSLAALPRVTVTERGTFYALSDALPLPGVLTYGEAGEFRGITGRRGNGPGEFERSWRLAHAPGGGLVVWDIANGVQTFDSEGDFVARTPGGRVPLPVTDPVILDDRVAVVMPRAPLPDAPDRTVVLFDLESGEFVGGSGPVFDAEAPRGPVHLAPACRGGFWSVRQNTVVERWSTGGELDATLRWPTDWAERAARHIEVPIDEVLDFRVHEACETGLMWFLAVLRDPTADGSETTPVRPGQPFPPFHFDAARLNRIHNTVVGVLDPDDGQVLALRSMDANVYQFLPDGRLLTMREDDVGHQWAEVVRLELEGR